MFLSDGKLFMPADGWVLVKRLPSGDGSYEVVELSVPNKQKICPAFQVPTSVVGRGGERMMNVEIVLPCSCHLSRVDKVQYSEVFGDDNMLVPVETVMAWTWDDDRLRPPPVAVQ